MKRIVLIVSAFGLSCSVFAKGVYLSSTSFSVDIRCIEPKYRFCAQGDLAQGTELTIFPVDRTNSCRARAVKSLAPSVTGLEELVPCSDAFDDGVFLGIVGQPIKEFRDIYRMAYFPKVSDASKKEAILALLKKSDVFLQTPERSGPWDWKDRYPIDQPLEVYQAPIGKNIFLIHIPSVQFHPGPLFVMVGDKFYSPGKPWGRMIGFWAVDGRKLIQIESDDPASRKSDDIFYWIDE